MFDALLHRLRPAQMFVQEIERATPWMVWGPVNHSISQRSARPSFAS